MVRHLHLLLQCSFKDQSEDEAKLHIESGELQKRGKHRKYIGA